MMSDDRLERFTEAVLSRDSGDRGFASAMDEGRYAAVIAYAAAKELDRIESEEANLTVDSPQE